MDTTWRKAIPCLSCSLCDCLLLENGMPSKYGAKIQSMLFHDPCESCSQDVDYSDYCAFCQHLRMRHLLFCLSNKNFFKSMKVYGRLKNLAIELGSIPTLESRKRCPLCRFFYNTMTARYRLWQQRSPWGSNAIVLDFSGDGAVLRESSEVTEPWQSPLDPFLNDTPLYCRTPRIKSRVARFSTHEIRERSSTSRVLSSKVNWSTLHQWMREFMLPASLSQSEDLCSQHTSTPRLPQPLLVVDVGNGCIVSKPSSYTYAALSYVWGNPTQGDLQATLANISDLQKPGALKQAGIPLTILDAMTAASELGIPYLWVDRLCIVQDDPTTKHNLINQMDSIYANALVTFVAGAGEDASYGLPGVSKERSLGQAHIRIQDIELAEVLPRFCKDIMPGMAWMKRGWTYQEAIFSENLIFFTDHGVFYQRMKESLKLLAEPSNSHDGIAFSGRTDFFASVEAYSGRTLSHETDIEKAFSGVLQSYYGEEHAYGSPLRFFDSALRWTSNSKQRKPRRSTKNDIFPSWSWLSVMGKVDFSDAQFDERSLSVATWAMMLPTADGKSKVRFIGVERHGSSRIDPELLDTAWTAGFCKGEHPSHPSSDADSAVRLNSLSINLDRGPYEYPALKRDPWEHFSYEYPALGCLPWEGFAYEHPAFKCHSKQNFPYEYYWLQIRGLQSTSAPMDLLFPEEYHHRLRPGQVLVHTRLASFRKSHSQDGRLSLLYIEDAKSDIRRQNGCLQGHEIVSGRDFDMGYLCGNLEELEYVEVIALSFTDGTKPPSWLWPDSTPDVELFRPRRSNEILRVDVMLIRRVGGVAHRMGFGWVSLEAWIKAKSTFETIVLG